MFNPYSSSIAMLNAAIKQHKLRVIVYNTKQVREVVAKLYNLGLISSFSIIGASKFYRICINIKYNNKETGNSVLRSLKQISTPGKRLYVQYKQLKGWSRNVDGLSVNNVLLLLTPRGLLTDTESVRYKTGGELILIVN